VLQYRWLVVGTHVTSGSRVRLICLATSTIVCHFCLPLKMTSLCAVQASLALWQGQQQQRSLASDMDLDEEALDEQLLGTSNNTAVHVAAIGSISGSLLLVDLLSAVKVSVVASSTACATRYSLIVMCACDQLANISEAPEP